MCLLIDIVRITYDVGEIKKTIKQKGSFPDECNDIVVVTLFVTFMIKENISRFCN